MMCKFSYKPREAPTIHRCATDLSTLRHLTTKTQRGRSKPWLTIILESSRKLKVPRPFCTKNRTVSLLKRVAVSIWTEIAPGQSALCLIQREIRKLSKRFEHSLKQVWASLCLRTVRWRWRLSSRLSWRWVRRNSTGIHYRRLSHSGPSALLTGWRTSVLDSPDLLSWDQLSYSNEQLC